MNKQGFTLVEVLVAIVIVGIALVSLIAANSSFTSTNDYGVKLSTSEFLIEQIREMTRLLPISDPNGGTTFGPEESALADYDDLDDFDGSDGLGSEFSPPINSERVSLSDFSSFTQKVTIQYVSASDFQTVVNDGTTGFVRVTVAIFLNSKPITSASWIRATY
ncbi:MAG: type II secretion system protein [Planctomycetes bacterium]|nr:type II secretion system protein [Planctomycetota bacterium]